MVMKPISPFNHRMRCDKGEFSAKRRGSGSTRYFNASPFYTQAQWVLVFWYLRRYDLIRLVPAADPEFSGEKVLTGREKVSKRLFRNLFPMNLRKVWSVMACTRTLTLITILYLLDTDYHTRLQFSLSLGLFSAHF